MGPTPYPPRGGVKCSGTVFRVFSATGTSTVEHAEMDPRPPPAPPVAVGVAVGAALKPAKHSLPAEGARWIVTVDIDGEAISEPWVMQGGVPKHDVAHCCKPAGLAWAP